MTSGWGTWRHIFIFISHAIIYILQKLLESSGFPPIRKDMADLLQHISDLEASHIEHSLSSMLMGIHLSRHTSLVDQLLQHSAALLEMVQQHEGGVRSEIPDELSWQCRQLSDRQKKLAMEATDLKSLPKLGSKVQVGRLEIIFGIRFISEDYITMNWIYVIF